MKRCGHSNFSCGRPCNKLLSCGKHKCELSCHDGACPPCSKTAFHKCQCGRISALRACAESDYRCEIPCGQQLSCQKHWCERGCHGGPCGDCLLTGKRSCPCGKVEHQGIPCDVAVPTCGSTCEKVLPCKIHCCSERCHYGSCNGTCRIVLTKFCRCGGLRKEVNDSMQIYMEFNFKHCLDYFASCHHYRAQSTDSLCVLLEAYIVNRSLVMLSLQIFHIRGFHLP